MGNFPGNGYVLSCVISYLKSDIHVHIFPRFGQAPPPLYDKKERVKTADFGGGTGGGGSFPFQTLV